MHFPDSRPVAIDPAHSRTAQAQFQCAACVARAVGDGRALLAVAGAISALHLNLEDGTRVLARRLHQQRLTAGTPCLLVTDEGEPQNFSPPCRRMMHKSSCFSPFFFIWRNSPKEVFNKILLENRLGKKKTLKVTTSTIDQKFMLLFSLNTFCNHFQTEAFPQ